MFLCVATVLLSEAQNDPVVGAFDLQRERMATNSMLVLGGWAVGTMITGGVGLTQVPATSESGRFHQMNIAWNAVNLGIALPAYLRGRKRLRRPTDTDLAVAVDAQRRTEKVYLINFGLDLGYIGLGAWMREHARTDVKDPDLWAGSGSSLLVQGGFLLLFDGVNHWLHTRHWQQQRTVLWRSPR